jgi:hypothetical protein
MAAMNAVSSRRGAESIKYYMINAKWFIRAWPLLKYGEDVSRDSLGPLNNQELLCRRELRWDLVHERDFFLVGSNAWLLIQQKFMHASDVEIALLCELHGSNLGIRILQPRIPENFPGLMIFVPLTGRFAYEACPLLQKKAQPEVPLGNVSDDEGFGDDLVSSTAVARIILDDVPLTSFAVSWFKQCRKRRHVDGQSAAGRTCSVVAASASSCACETVFIHG